MIHPEHKPRNTSQVNICDGPVDGTTPEVGYHCSGDEPLIQRRTAIILPDGRLIPYDYGAENSIDDVLNRVASIHDDATLEVLATFGYLGAAMPAITTLPTPALQRRWKKLRGTPDGDGGDPYTSYDRFSRTEQSIWLKQTGESTYEPRVHVQWGYDRNSLRTWRKDLLAPSATQQDQAFLYDQLQQIVNRQRGVLNINHTAAGGIPAETEAWDHDEQGNCPRSQTRDDLRSGFACNEPLIAAKQWKRYDTTEDGQPAIEKTRGHNESNQITKIDGSSANVAHDANGNMTLVPASAPTGPQGNLEGPPLKTTWDAWNCPRSQTRDDLRNGFACNEPLIAAKQWTRLVHDQNDVPIQDNRYDGLTRRTQEITSAGTRHFYYNDQWRSVEERLDTATTPERQHIWHPTDRWTMIRRDRDTTGNGTLDERLWCLKDDLDPVAIADPTGAIIERLSYTAFGITTFLTPAFEPRSGNQSDFAWNLLFHVEFADPVTGWMHYGFRFYAPAVGRWLARDPIGEAGSIGLYAFLENSPYLNIDILGERSSCLENPPCGEQGEVNIRTMQLTFVTFQDDIEVKAPREAIIDFFVRITKDAGEDLGGRINEYLGAIRQGAESARLILKPFGIPFRVMNRVGLIVDQVLMDVTYVCCFCCEEDGKKVLVWSEVKGVVAPNTLRPLYNLAVAGDRRVLPDEIAGVIRSAAQKVADSCPRKSN